MKLSRTLRGKAAPIRALPVCLTLGLACASIEPGRYGVSSLEISGQRAVSAAAIEECLITRERERFAIDVGLGDLRCGVPPFDGSPVRLRLWRWPWTEWPSFDRAVFERDMESVQRFYRARGHYEARIVEVRYHPEHAGNHAARARCQMEDCRLHIRIVVDEGPPSRVERVAVSGLESLPEGTQRAARAAVSLAPGDPPDEARHAAGKGAIRRALVEAGWAGARVSGSLVVHVARRRALVEYAVEPGPRYHFGEVHVEDQGELPREPIERAADLDSGAPFDPAVLREIRAEVVALGAFSAVQVEERLDASTRRADVIVRVTPLPRDALRVGAGVLSGTLRRTETADEQSIPQWDLHLLGRYQRRHLFRTLAQLTVEDRPRLIFGAAFPLLEQPRSGNVVSLALAAPGWLEPRTSAFARSVWDYGPDPYLGVLRSDLFLRAGATRGFFGRRVIATLALQQDLFSTIDAPPAGSAVRAEGSAGTGAAGGSDGAAEIRTVPSSYRYLYLEQDVRLDLRDARRRPRSGVYLALNASQAPRWAASDWTAFRLAPEARAYARLPLDIVLAQRVSIAGLFVLDADPALDALSRELGPNVYRLRGGGASSNRGFLAGRLGTGLDGGTRRWEASLELRIPIGRSLVLAGFADAGDVSRGAIRFGHLNTTLGYGLRYFTVIGAIRLDVGHRVPGWQRVDGSTGIDPGAAELPLSSAPGAVHLTIGDPF